MWEVAPHDVHRYGIVTPENAVSECFAIADIVEKPSAEDAPSNLAVAARYIFDRRIFDAIDSIQVGHGGELWLTDAIQALIAAGQLVQCVRLKSDEIRYDIGNPTSYYRAFADFALADPEHGDVLASYLRSKLDGAVAGSA